MLGGQDTSLTNHDQHSEATPDPGCDNPMSVLNLAETKKTHTKDEKSATYSYSEALNELLLKQVMTTVDEEMIRPASMSAIFERSHLLSGSYLEPVSTCNNMKAKYESQPLPGSTESLLGAPDKLKFARKSVRFRSPSNSPKGLYPSTQKNLTSVPGSFLPANCSPVKTCNTNLEPNLPNLGSNQNRLSHALMRDPSSEDSTRTLADISDLILKLNSEIGYDKLWNNLTNTLQVEFIAQGASLSLPNDATDLINTPWGLKAVWRNDDGFLTSEKPTQNVEDKDLRESLRPKKNVPLPSKSNQKKVFTEIPNSSKITSSLRFHGSNSDDDWDDTFDECISPRKKNSLNGINDKVDQKKAKIDIESKSYKKPFDSSCERPPNKSSQWYPEEKSPRAEKKTNIKARTKNIELFAKLARLDSECESLIDNDGVVTILERGRANLLQRRYYQDSTKAGAQATRRSYFDAEQVTLSPWLRSPAPSPAMTSPNERNPFFTYMEKNEFYNPEDSKMKDNSKLCRLTADLKHTFAVSDDTAATRPDLSGSNSLDSSISSISEVYDSKTVVESIEFDCNTKSVIHLPLFHPGKDSTVGDFFNQKQAPIAILSIVSTMIPYDSELLELLVKLGPHIACAISQAQAHTNLLNQIDMLSFNQSVHLLSPIGNRKFSPFPKGRNASYFHNSSSPVTTPSTRLGKQSFFHTKSKSIQWPIKHSDKPGTSFLDEKQCSHNDWPERKLYVPIGDGVDGYIQVGEIDADTSIDGRPSPIQKNPDTGELYNRASGHLKSQGESLLPESESSLHEITTKLTPKPKLGHYSKFKARYARRTRSFILSHGASFLTASEVASNPPSDEEFTSNNITRKGHRPANLKTLPSRPISPSHNTSSSIYFTNKSSFPTPSTKLLRTMIDSIPVQVFTAEPGTGRITWVSNRTLAYRGQSREDFYRNSNKSIHEDDRKVYETEWSQCIKTGESMNMILKLRRFDGRYRVFYVRSVPLKDERGVIVHWFATCTDIHDKRKAEEEASRQAHEAASDHKYKILAESSPIIVFAADPAKGISYSNAKWFEYSGRSVSDTIGLRFLEFVHPEDRHLCLLPNNPGDKKSSDVSFDPDNGIYSFELRLMNKNKDYRWHLVRVKSAGTEDLDRGLWFGTCTDINDQKLIQEKLQEAKDNAQKIIESKSRFLSNMSHEIRTPLIGISGMVSFLLDTSLTAEQLDYCHTISTSSEALLMVINDILDLSKVESGKMTLNPEWFHIRIVIEEAIELLSSMFISKNLELNYIVDNDVPVWIEGDRIRIRQVLLNIIGNAIKFTDEGEIFVSCKKADHISEPGIITESPSSIDLKFEVHDTGRGFTKKDKQYMFKPFSQVDETRNRKSTFLPNSQNQDNRGTGLGLVISQQLVQLHGGDLTCSSIKDVGSTFCFNIKVNVASEKYHPSMLDGSKVMTAFKGVGTIPQNAVLTRSQSTKAERYLPTLSNLSFANDVLTEVAPQLNRSKSECKFRPMNPAKKNSSSRESESGKSDKLRRDSDSDISKKTSSLKMNILIICPLKFSTQTIRHNIQSVIPSPFINSYSITDCSCLESAINILSTQSLESWWTHVIINLTNKNDALAAINEIIYNFSREVKYKNTQILLLTTMAQRSELSKLLSEGEKDLNRIGFIFKPLKPSKFSHIFNPHARKLDSQDLKLINSQGVISNQTNVFSSIRSLMGDRQLRILLVEDNLVNQKVLTRFFSKVGLESETATDGEDCLKKLFNTPVKFPGKPDDQISQITEKLSSNEKYFTSKSKSSELISEIEVYKQFDLILCDLDMPRKNGFQTCKEIRLWEKENMVNETPLPIIALSAYVMSDVAEKCREAGFTSYISKPVDFKVLKEKIIDVLGKKISTSTIQGK
ncbi:hypothetical protein NADFUDRAFT_48401 [Nadsonia fulvescens var. elongata DSM 6958]|uniref:histidine kinase n=1 Tax=Nadsonia fulvescens var. elongata DSM 6958 TaxID=857566 RepID=A0A1E3PSB7_9ASCO|nr:hypothetical protein NADFUDRAFT_48401 [Nadsonia fulvescens var. elongata DSM 6958]